MSKAIEELELKFSHFNTKIENKVNVIKNIYSEQQSLLNERFDEESLCQKYSGEFNNFRQRLLHLIANNLRSEINRVNEFVINRKNNNRRITKYELEEPRSLNFKRIFTLKKVCIRKLIMQEFKLGRNLSASIKYIKYKHILGISEHIVHNMDKALIVAIKKENPKPNSDILRLLIDAGANVNSKDETDTTALALASKKGDLEMVKFLVENGACVNAEGAHGLTALLWASCFSRFEIAKYLIEHGAGVNTKGTYDCRELLMLASQNGHLEMVKYLIQSGVGVNARNKNHRTALMFACQNGQLKIVKYLVEHGADVNAKDGFEQTPIEIARRIGFNGIGLNNRSELIEYLIQHGAASSSKDCILC